MRRLRLVGWFLFLIGLAILTVLSIEEILYNLNYYYNHQVNFVLLIVGGALPLAIGSVILLEEEPEKQPSSKIKNDNR
jgi:hypothetical protein